MKATKQFNTGVIKFEFRDEDGEVFSSFKMNPTDVNLLKRMEEVADYFENRKFEVPEDVSGEELAAFNKEIEDKINYLLGYDAAKDIFSEITATTVSPDGDIFAFVVLESIADNLKPEMEKRKQSMANAAAKYTAKYGA